MLASLVFPLERWKCRREQVLRVVLLGWQTTDACVEAAAVRAEGLRKNVPGLETFNNDVLEQKIHTVVYVCPSVLLRRSFPRQGGCTYVRSRALSFPPVLKFAPSRLHQVCENNGRMVVWLVIDLHDLQNVAYASGIWRLPATGSPVKELSRKL